LVIIFAMSLETSRVVLFRSLDLVPAPPAESWKSV
jgi:hypothetical protein